MSTKFKINLETAGREDDEKKIASLLYAAAIKDGALKKPQQGSRTVSESYEDLEELKEHDKISAD